MSSSMGGVDGGGGRCGPGGAVLALLAVLAVGVVVIDKHAANEGGPQVPEPPPHAIILLRCPSGLNDCDGSDPPLMFLHGSPPQPLDGPPSRVAQAQLMHAQRKAAAATDEPGGQRVPPPAQVAHPAPPRPPPAPAPPMTSTPQPVRPPPAAPPPSPPVTVLATQAKPTAPTARVLLAASAPLFKEKGWTVDQPFSTLRVSLASMHPAKELPWAVPEHKPLVAGDKALYVPGCSVQKQPPFAASEPVGNLTTAYSGNYEQVFIITLRRDAQRLRLVMNVTHFLKGANVVWAIDGRAAITDEILANWQREKYLGRTLKRSMDPTQPVGRPKIACLMSHVRVWEQLANDPDPEKYYIMMEDDAFPMPKFEFRLHGILQDLKKLPVMWDWVYLSIHPRYADLNVATINGMRHINTAPRMVGNAGYLISRQGARKILAGAVPFTVPKDEAVNRMICARLLHAYIVKTPLIGVRGQQGRGFESSLRKDPSRVLKSNIWDW